MRHDTLLRSEDDRPGQLSFHSSFCGLRSGGWASEASTPPSIFCISMRFSYRDLFFVFYDTATLGRPRTTYSAFENLFLIIFLHKGTVKIQKETIIRYGAFFLI